MTAFNFPIFAEDLREDASRYPQQDTDTAYSYALMQSEGIRCQYLMQDLNFTFADVYCVLNTFKAHLLDDNVPYFSDEDLVDEKLGDDEISKHYNVILQEVDGRSILMNYNINPDPDGDGENLDGEYVWSTFSQSGLELPASGFSGQTTWDVYSLNFWHDGDQAYRVLDWSMMQADGGVTLEDYLANLDWSQILAGGVTLESYLANLDWSQILAGGVTLEDYLAELNTYIDTSVSGALSDANDYTDAQIASIPSYTIQGVSPSTDGNFGFPLITSVDGSENVLLSTSAGLASVEVSSLSGSSFSATEAPSSWDELVPVGSYINGDLRDYNMNLSILTTEDTISGAVLSTSIPETTSNMTAGDFEQLLVQRAFDEYGVIMATSATNRPSLPPHGDIAIAEQESGGGQLGTQFTDETRIFDQWQSWVYRNLMWGSIFPASEIMTIESEPFRRGTQYSSGAGYDLWTYGSSDRLFPSGSYMSRGVLVADDNSINVQIANLFVRVS